MKRHIGSKINLEQKELLIGSAMVECEKLFTEGEKSLGIVVQQKPVFNMLPQSVVVTNKRVILHKPHLFKATFTDYLWKDMVKVHLTDTVFGSRLDFVFQKGKLSASYLPKNQAKRVYALAQAREEEWVEKRRMRGIEEARAESGANYITVGGSGSKLGIKERLLELEELLKEGLLTQDEYQNKKMEILELI